MRKYPDLGWKGMTDQAENLPVFLMFNKNTFRSFSFEMEQGENEREAAQRFSASVLEATGSYL